MKEVKVAEVNEVKDVKDEDSTAASVVTLRPSPPSSSFTFLHVVHLLMFIFPSFVYMPVIAWQWEEANDQGSATADSQTLPPGRRHNR
ncbi:MAG: hypothetical protein ACRD5G_14765, partial [Candidatus Acidiferrales bacterium]